MATATTARYSVEEYLALERPAPTRSEYRDGEIVPMSGASEVHNTITLNVALEIKLRIRGRGWKVYANDMRVCLEPNGLYAYPDVIVVTEQPRLLDDHFDTLLNPTLIVEVLSPSTESYDRGEKFDRCRRLESLREYVLVAQDEMRGWCHSRRGEEWDQAGYAGRDGLVRFTSIGCDVPIREIYAQTGLSDRGE